MQTVKMQKEADSDFLSVRNSTIENNGMLISLKSSILHIRKSRSKISSWKSTTHP